MHVHQWMWVGAAACSWNVRLQDEVMYVGQSSLEYFKETAFNITPTPLVIAGCGTSLFLTTLFVPCRPLIVFTSSDLFCV